MTLKVVPNHKLSMEMVKLSTADFASTYEPFLKDPEVDVKLARIDITAGADAIYLFLFRRATGQATVSDLGESERQMSTGSRIVYKWMSQLKWMQVL